MLECIVLPLLVGAGLFYILTRWVEEAPKPPEEAPKPLGKRQLTSHGKTIQQSWWASSVDVTHRYQRLIEKLKHRNLNRTYRGYLGNLEMSERNYLEYQIQQELTEARTEHHSLRRHLKGIHRAHKKLTFSLAPSRGRLQMEQIGVGSGRGRPFIIVMTRNELIVYPESPQMSEYYVFSRDQLRWFGHPDTRQPPEAEQLWLHFEVDRAWWVLRMAMDYDDLVRLLAVLRDFAPALMPPYHRGLHVHYGPIPAHRAEQEITGEWTLYEQRTLYLMPLYIVVLDGDTVHELVPVESITHVASVPRLDAPGGVVRFRVAGEDLAYALDDFDSFAAALADAAQDSLEAPLEIVERKGKKALKE